MSACEVCGSIGTVATLQDPVTLKVVGHKCGVCGARILYTKEDR